jgi:hypothetical protein
MEIIKEPAGTALCHPNFSIYIYIYMGAAISEWQMQLKCHFSLGPMILDTLLFAADQVIFAISEDELHMATLQFTDTQTTCKLKISYDKTKNMTFRGKYQIRSKKILNNKTTEQIQKFNYIGGDASFNCDNDLRQIYTNFDMHVTRTRIN